MLILKGLAAWEEKRGLDRSFQVAKPVVALGNFDGVHLGHQEILKRTVLTAQRIGGTPICFTFWPHPLQVLNPTRAPKLIQTLAQRQDCIASLGIQMCMVEPFDLAFSRKGYEEFFEKNLYGILRPHAVRVGVRFAFGFQRQGDAGKLDALCQRYGIDFAVVPEVRLEGEEVSSSRIRALLGQGQVDRARLLLGRAYTVCGRVVRGDGRGRLLHFPTANLETENDLMLPFGVYTCRVARLGGAQHWIGVANLGVRPTFAAKKEGVDQPVLEIHILDFQEEIYGETLQVEILHALRAERRFAGMKDLGEQIQKDCEEARKWVAMAKYE